MQRGNLQLQNVYYTRFRELEFLKKLNVLFSRKKVYDLTYSNFGEKIGKLRNVGERASGVKYAEGGERLSYATNQL